MAQPALISPPIEGAIEATLAAGFVADDRPDVVRCLQENLDLLPVLERIRRRLEPPLATEIPLRLQLVYGPEWEDDRPRLFVLIQTELEADPALDALDEVRREWWLEEFRRFGDRLSLGLDYI
jgi:hypothetical protein